MKIAGFRQGRADSLLMRAAAHWRTLDFKKNEENISRILVFAAPTSGGMG